MWRLWLKQNLLSYQKSIKSWRINGINAVVNSRWVTHPLQSPHGNPSRCQAAKSADDDAAALEFCSRSESEDDVHAETL
jgi:hypothetical protein